MLFSMTVVLALTGLPMHSYGAEESEQRAAVLSEAEYVPGEAIIVVKNSVASDDPSGYGSESGGETGIDSLGSIPGINEITALMRTDASPDDLTDPGAFTGGSLPSLKGADDVALPAEGASETICLVRSDSLDTNELIERLKDEKGVVSAEPNWIYHLEEVENADRISEEVILREIDPESAEQTETPDPDLTPDQYMTVGEYGIDVPDWNDPTKKNAVSASGEQTIVAVVDSGVKYDHADLKNVMWDEGENYPALTALGGGKYGFNAGGAAGYTTKYPTTDPMDENHHGTHVAGIIAGEWNGKGVSGIANGAKIMAVRAADARGDLTASAVILAYNYLEAALEAGVPVRVINNSWGGSYSSYAFKEVIREVARHDVVICFASGNESQDADVKLQQYASFSDLPNVIVVNATDQNGKLADFSDFGSDQTDVAAPGVDIMSTFLTKTIDPRYSNGFAVNDFDDRSDFGEYTVTGAEAQITADGREGNGLKITGRFIEGTPVRITFPAVRPSDPAGAGSTNYLAASIRREGSSEYIIKAYAADSTAAINLVTQGDTNGWSFGSLNLVSEKWDQLDLTLELENKASENEDFTLYLDDLKLINGEDGFFYAYSSGTSMACPVVAGEAAVLAAKFPEDAVDKLSARIIGSVRRSDSLAGKCVSGGIANLRYALDDEKTAPVLFSAQKDDNLIRIGGYFFGKEKGTVTLDGSKLSVTSWNENEITAKLPSDFQAGDKLIEVHKVTGDESLRDGHRRFVTGAETGSDETGDYTYLSPEGMELLSKEEIMDIISVGGRIYITTTLDEEDNDRGYPIYEYVPDTNLLVRKASDVQEDPFASDQTKKMAPVIVSNTAYWNEQLVFLARNQTHSGEEDTYDYALVTFDPESDEISSTPIALYTDYPLFPLSGFMLANVGEELLILGGYGNFYIGGLTFDSIYRYDPDGKRVIEAGKLSTRRGEGSVFTYDGDTYLLYGLTNKEMKTVAQTSLEKLVKNDDGSYGSVVVADHALPEGINANELGSRIQAAVSPCDDGVLLTGLPRENSFGAVDMDTWMMHIGISGITFTETGKRFSLTRTTNQCGTICDGRYYVLGNTSLGDRGIRFGYLEGYEKAELTTVSVGEYVISYLSRIPYAGRKITADDLQLTIRSSDGTKAYLPGSVGYKSNKAPGAAQFTIKTLAWEAVRDPFTVKKAGKEIRKALARTALPFTITKRILNDGNTIVTMNKSGMVSSVKYWYMAPNGKKKTLTVSKKDYTVTDGTIHILPSSKCYQGAISVPTGNR